MSRNSAKAAPGLVSKRATRFQAGGYMRNFICEQRGGCRHWRRTRHAACTGGLLRIGAPLPLSPTRPSTSPCSPCSKCSPGSGFIGQGFGLTHRVYPGIPPSSWAKICVTPPLPRKSQVTPHVGFLAELGFGDRLGCCWPRRGRRRRRQRRTQRCCFVRNFRTRLDYCHFDQFFFASGLEKVSINETPALV